MRNVNEHRPWLAVNDLSYIFQNCSTCRVANGKDGTEAVAVEDIVAVESSFALRWARLRGAP